MITIMVKIVTTITITWKTINRVKRIATTMTMVSITIIIMMVVDMTILMKIVAIPMTWLPGGLWCLRCR